MHSHRTGTGQGEPAARSAGKSAGVSDARTPVRSAGGFGKHRVRRGRCPARADSAKRARRHARLSHRCRTLAGGVFAGLAASLCCIGPLLSLSLGLGSFAAAAWFAQWRPVFLVVTFVLLGLAWYLTYRRAKVTCADGSCARPPGKAVRFSLWLGTLVAVAAAVYPSLPAARHPLASAPITAGDARLTVQIPSMDCPPCAKGIEASLNRAPGVKQASVDYETKAAVLIYDPRITNRDQLLALIDATGFPAERSSLR